MKTHLYNPKYILAFAGLMFCVAYIDSLSVPNLSYACAFQCLHTVGKIAVALFCSPNVVNFIDTI